MSEEMKLDEAYVQPPWLAEQGQVRMFAAMAMEKRRDLARLSESIALFIRRYDEERLKALRECLADRSQTICVHCMQIAHVNNVVKIYAEYRPMMASIEKRVMIVCHECHTLIQSIADDKTSQSVLGDFVFTAPLQANDDRRYFERKGLEEDLPPDVLYQDDVTYRLPDDIVKEFGISERIVADTAYHTLQIGDEVIQC